MILTVVAMLHVKFKIMIMSVIRVDVVDVDRFKKYKI